MIRKEYYESGWAQWKKLLSKFPEFTDEMTSLEEYTWASRVIGTRSFGKFMPHVTLFPVGELLNHDNVQTYYIYQHDRERPDASSRYSGIVDQLDHDEDLLVREPVIENKTEILFQLNQQLNELTKDMEKVLAIKGLCSQVDKKEEAAAKEHKKYRPPDMDLTESDEKDASICAGPDEHYLPGSEVYMSYGRYSNRQLLSNYGFSLKVNHFNYARVKILLQELTVEPRIRDFLNAVQAFVSFKLKKDWIAEEFLRSIRGLHWNFMLNVESFLYPGNHDLEKKVLETGIFILNEYLKKFRTSYEEDLKLMSGDLELRKYFAVLYRSQVKEIILNQIKYMKIANEIIDRNRSCPLPDCLGLVEQYETAEGNFYLEISQNRKALESYLNKFN